MTYKHRFGCTCAGCTQLARERLNEVRRVAEHNRQALYGRPTGDHHATPPAHAAGDMYYRAPWAGQPYPGELEYLNRDAGHAHNATGRRY